MRDPSQIADAAPKSVSAPSVGVSFLLALGCGVAGYVARERWHAQVSGLTIASLLLLAIEAVLDRGSSASRLAEGRLVPRLAMLGAAATWALAAAFIANQPITGWNPYEDDYPMLPIAALTMILVPLLAAFTLFARAAAWALGRRPALAAALVRGATAVGLLVSAALVLAGGLRSLRFADPVRYAASLPVVASLSLPKEPSGSLEVPLADARFAWQCDDRGDTCSGTLQRLSAKLVPSDWRHHLRFRRGSGIALRHDAAAGLWMLEADTRQELVDRARAVYGGPELRGCFPNAADLADRLAPPRGWLGGALVGVGLGALGLSRGVRARRRLAALREAVQGTQSADGWVSFADGRPPLELPSPVAEGPVVVRFAQAGAGVAYRGAETRVVAEARAGVLARVLEEAQAEVLAREAFALAAVALLGAPLAVAALLGFVG